METWNDIFAQELRMQRFFLKAGGFIERNDPMETNDSITAPPRLNGLSKCYSWICKQFPRACVLLSMCKKFILLDSIRKSVWRRNYISTIITFWTFPSRNPHVILSLSRFLDRLITQPLRSNCLVRRYITHFQSRFFLILFQLVGSGFHLPTVPPSDFFLNYIMIPPRQSCLRYCVTGNRMHAKLPFPESVISWWMRWYIYLYEVINLAA